MTEKSINLEKLIQMYVLGILPPSLASFAEEAVCSELKLLVWYLTHLQIAQEDGSIQVSTAIQQYYDELDPNFLPALRTVMKDHEEFLRHLIDDQMSDVLTRGLIIKKGMGDEEYARAYCLFHPEDDLLMELMERLNKESQEFQESLEEIGRQVEARFKDRNPE